MNAIILTPQLTRRFRNSNVDLTKQNPTRFKDKNSTFEFIEPHMKGTSSRKKLVSDDTASILSFNRENECKPVKKRRLSRMNSLSVFLTPAKQMRKVGNIMLTRAKSAANLSESPCSVAEFASPTLRSNSLRSSYRPKDDEHHAMRMRDDLSEGYNTSRLSRNRPGSSRKKATHESFKRGRPWIEKFSEDKRPFIAAEMSYWERERQEAIYELYKGEKYLVKDLEMVVQAYKNSLICLKILQSSEAEHIFGPIDALLPLHKELKSQIKEAKDSETKTVASVGEILNNWVGQLESVYIPYLSNQTQAKQLLDSKRANCKNLEEFLDLCIQSEFSRRLDLWNFLDVPRSKLMKYPLLLKSILKHTPEGHDDKDFLPEVISKIEKVIKSVDKRTGEANCKYLLQKLQFSEERQREPFLYEAKTILCQGELKNNRGTKLHGFLFDSGFLLTRLVEDHSEITYKAHKQPISAYNLVFQDLNEESRSGSFKSTFSFSNKGKNIFQVSSKNESETFILSASNEHDKQEWLQRLKDVTDSLVSPNLETPRQEENDVNVSREKNEENYFTAKKRKNKDRTSMRSKAFSNTPVTELQQPSKMSTPTNQEEINVATPKSVIKKGLESCRSLLRQKSNKSLNSPMEAPPSNKRRRLSEAKKLLKEAQNLSPTS